MDTQELIKELESIQEDAYWASGCSHEDALSDSLKDIEQDLKKLIEKLTSTQDKLDLLMQTNDNF